MNSRRALLRRHHDRLRFFDGLRDQLLPVFAEHGFRGNHWYYSRLNEPFFNGVSLGEADDHTGCYVDLGFHLTYLSDVFGKRKSITDLQGGMSRFREQLRRDKGDRFWPFREFKLWELRRADQQVDRVVQELVSAFMTRGLAMYDEFNSLDKLLAITVDDIRNEREVRFCGKLTVGWAYDLSQIHRHVGNTERSRELARFGLKCVGDRPSRDERPLVARFEELTA